MRRIYRNVVLIFVSTAVFALLLGDRAVFAQPGPPPSAAENNKGLSPSSVPSLDMLINDLSSPRFLVRERATELLDSLGEEHLPELENRLAQLTDLESQVRLTGVVVRKQNALRQRIIKSFIRAADPDECGEFLGWAAFSKQVGTNDRKAKFTFLTMMDRYPELIYKNAGVREQVLPLARSTAARLSERMDSGGELVEADGIAILFLACLCEDKIDAGLENTCHRVFAKSPFSTMLTNDPKLKSTTVKLYSRWTQYTSNKRAVLLRCLDSELDVARQVARSVLQTKDAAQEDPDSFELAMHAMARHGIEEDIPVIEQWLNDKTVIMEYQRIAPPEIGGQRLILFQVEARDLALAATIVRHGENPFNILPLFRSHPLRGFISETLGLPKEDSDSERLLRLKRWEEYKERRKMAPETLPSDLNRSTNRSNSIPPGDN